MEVRVKNMISVKNNFFYLETKKTSYVIRILSNGTLQHVYYGKKVKQDDMSYYHLFQGHGFSPLIKMDEGWTSLDTIPQEYPVFGRGDYRNPALIVETSDGRCVNELSFREFEVISGRMHLEGLPQLDANIEAVQTLAIKLQDQAAGYEVTLYYSVFFDEDVISRYVCVKNVSDDTIQIRNIASLSVDFENSSYELLTLKGAWARERHISRRQLEHGITSIESRRGASSHHLNPFAALVSKNTDEFNGSAYGFSFIYSADFKISAEVSQYECTRVQVGINPETFSWKLMPGEVFITPEAIMTYSDCGLNNMSQNFHNVCRNHLGKCADKTLSHPIIINSWEAMYFELNEEKIKKFILDCKDLGIDTFVMDDGWFGHRDWDDSSLGDWFVDKKKFPNGLHHIIDFCHQHGMKFGIWFEPEMISHDSLLYKKHPEWCIHYKDVSPVECRNQYVLDMSRKDVVDGIFEQMEQFLTEYDVSYVKWDFNRNLTDNGSAMLPIECQKEHTHRYMLGVYDLMKRLNNRFPKVFFEGCSGGGGRCDFGILYYAPQIWTSDDSDAMERLLIQYGSSLVYPPATMVGHVSACPNHQTGRITPFETRGEVAQMCNYGYELNVGELSKEEKKMICQQIEKHRYLDSMIQEGDFYRLSNPFENNLCAWQLVSTDLKQSYVMAVFQRKIPNAKGVYLKLRGLEDNADYFIKELGLQISGSTLMNAGIPIRMSEREYETISFELERREKMSKAKKHKKSKWISICIIICIFLASSCIHSSLVMGASGDVSVTNKTEITKDLVFHDQATYFISNIEPEADETVTINVNSQFRQIDRLNLPLK